MSRTQDKPVMEEVVEDLHDGNDLAQEEAVYYATISAFVELMLHYGPEMVMADFKQMSKGKIAALTKEHPIILA
jgi:hypothetical protein